FERTPLLVRRRKILEALQWLQLNHSGYSDVTISRENINSYSETEPPVSVVHLPSSGQAPSESLSVFDRDTEKGVHEGKCSFAVHGLTAPQLDDMSYDAKVAASLKHLQNGGSVIAYGHASQPESLYNNPGLFPSMFPWLFPYGTGGFEN
ncbi:hypothetical protein OBBRIDRAFT_696602, partial [Obba rivulosa]